MQGKAMARLRRRGKEEEGTGCVGWIVECGSSRPSRASSRSTRSWKMLTSKTLLGLDRGLRCVAGRWQDTWRRANAMVISRGSKLSDSAAGDENCLPDRDTRQLMPQTGPRLAASPESCGGLEMEVSCTVAFRSSHALGGRRRMLCANWPLHNPVHPQPTWKTCMRRPRRPPFTLDRVVERKRRALLQDDSISVGAPPSTSIPGPTHGSPLSRMPRMSRMNSEETTQKGSRAWIDEFRARKQNPGTQRSLGLPGPPCQNQLMGPLHRDRDASQSAIRPLIGPSLDKLRRWGLASVALLRPNLSAPGFSVSGKGPVSYRVPVIARRRPEPSPELQNPKNTPSRLIERASRIQPAPGFSSAC